MELRQINNPIFIYLLNNLSTYLFTVIFLTSFKSANFKFFVFNNFLAALLLNFFAADIIIILKPLSCFKINAFAPLSKEVPLILADSSLVLVGSCYMNKIKIF